ncbi:hypothetical protein BD413DRAFT_24173, partial [Trametes elegans]
GWAWRTKQERPGNAASPTAPTLLNLAITVRVRSSSSFCCNLLGGPGSVDPTALSSLRALALSPLQAQFIASSATLPRFSSRPRHTFQVARDTHNTLPTFVHTTQLACSRTTAFSPPSSPQAHYCLSSNHSQTTPSTHHTTSMQPTMSRRSPPSPLRLHVGPLPPRGKPKHTLPSMPRPAFYAPPSTTAPAARRGPVPRARMSHTELPALFVLPDAAGHGFGFGGAGLPGLFGAPVDSVYGGGSGSSSSSGASSPTSAASSLSSARPESARKKSREFVRGPWDHSGAIRVPFDVDAVLPPPRPTAVNLR